jgi:deoxycytidine triphosphate deaminase
MGILTKEAILRRLENNELTIRPILDIDKQIEEGSINLRLGTKFIITKRTEHGVITPPHLSASLIRKFQTKLHYRFGQKLLLHPGQLILASTFEFIGLPDNISAYVLSRSRYGRIGLMVATATYVHPNWKGTLTLELFNYGDAPIELECGAAIAQLVIQEANPPIPSPERENVLHIPTEPEFVEMKQDKDWDLLQFFRKLSGLKELKE